MKNPTALEEYNIFLYLDKSSHMLVERSIPENTIIDVIILLFIFLTSTLVRNDLENETMTITPHN
jgi:hypothetical protein